MSLNPLDHLPFLLAFFLVGLDNDSVDEFDTLEQSPVYDTDDPHSENLDYKDSPNPIADSYDWTNDDIDNDRALIDTGAMAQEPSTSSITLNCTPS